MTLIANTIQYHIYVLVENKISSFIFRLIDRNVKAIDLAGREKKLVFFLSAKRNQ